MKRGKKVLSLLLSLSLACSLMTVSAGAVSQAPFRDVSKGDWYYNSVQYVYAENLMKGTTTTAFSPQSSLTRGMFVTILGRMAGVNEGDYPGSSFWDVPEGQWYSPYVAWASENGIVSGYGSGTFGTNDNVTREQMATIIARYVAYAGITLPEKVDVVPFFWDAHLVSAYAKESLELMRTTGIISGDEKGYFNPKNTATRAQAATIFARLDQAIDPGKQPWFTEAVEVSFERKMTDNWEEYAVIKGLSEAGGVVWTRTTDRYEMTELDRINNLDIFNGIYYYVENGIVTALRLSDGELLWNNGEFYGSASAYIFDAEGTLYLCGYYGPDLFVVDVNGNTLCRIDSVSPDYWWPCGITYEGSDVLIFYEGTPSGEIEVVRIPSVR